MSSQAILEEKKLVVSEIVEKIKNSSSFVVVDYQGINVEQVTNLRNKAREAGVEYKIYKNTFLRFAAKECGYEALADSLLGQNAVVFSENDPVAPAKLIADFVKENRLQILEFKAGVIDKKISSADEIRAISQLPAKDVLLARILGSLNAPISKFVYAVNALKEKLEQEAS